MDVCRAAEQLTVGQEMTCHMKVLTSAACDQ
jgi:hypothetical protein